MMRDLGAFVGHWPFRALPHRNIDALEARLRREGIVEALVSPLDALFQQEPQDANQVLGSQTTGNPFYRFAPIMNPTLPGSARALARCREWDVVTAVRLIPGYHGYGPSDDAAVAFAKEAGVPIVVQMRMQDARSAHPVVRVPDVPWEGVVKLARLAPEVAVVATGANGVDIDHLAEAFAKLPNLHVTLSHLEGRIDPVGQFVERFGAERLLFATHAPLFTPTAARLKLETARIDATARRAISGGNFERLLG